MDAAGSSTGASDDNVDEDDAPSVGPSFQAHVEPWNGRVQEAGRDESVLIWHPDTGGSAVDEFLAQADQVVADDPRLIGSVPEFALATLQQTGGNIQEALAALPAVASRKSEALWSEEETAELEEAVSAHGSRLRQVHLHLADTCASTRSFPELVSQYFLTCYTTELADEKVAAPRPRIKGQRRAEAERLGADVASMERQPRLQRRGGTQMDPSEILASMLAAGMLEAGLAVRAAHTCPTHTHIGRKTRAHALPTAPVVVMRS